MTNQPADDNNHKEWQSVHKCPKCGHVVNLDETDLQVISTGMISCPTCGWFGPVRIKIMEQEQRNLAN
jgi:predicted RNA-binding Zn-ribbon protein involved in translation (DUF1610 family)